MIALERGGYNLNREDGLWDDRMVSMVVASTVIIRLQGYWTKIAQNNGELSLAVTQGFTVTNENTKDATY